MHGRSDGTCVYISDYCEITSQLFEWASVVQIPDLNLPEIRFTAYL